jgi:transposase-like protein
VEDILDKEIRFRIISEGLKNGVSITCRKHNISRTIYYRWLKRFKSHGIDGLEDQKKNFVPKNKTSKEIENQILNLMKNYPDYGPKALKYLLEELGYKISESAIYNVMNRNDLTNKYKRINYFKKHAKTITTTIPPLTDLKSGECWIFWITDYGHFKNIGHIYAYNLFDLKSRIACTRLYGKISFHNFEDLVTAVALSVATSLNLKTNYICLFDDRKILKHSDRVSETKFYKTFHDHGFDVKIHFMKDNEDIDQINNLKITYTEECMNFLLPLITDKSSFSELKLLFQGHIRNYNIHYKKQFDGIWKSPIEYHNQCTSTNLILPIWAYMDRNY